MHQMFDHARTARTIRATPQTTTVLKTRINLCEVRCVPVARFDSRVLTSQRLVTLALGIGVASLWIGALQLKPNESGLSTHTQLGLAPCGMLTSTGFPCPTCGITTSLARAARGDLLGSARAHAGGALFALGACGLLLHAALVGILGIPMPSLAERASPGGWAIACVAAILCGWGVKLAVGWFSGTFPIPL